MTRPDAQPGHGRRQSGWDFRRAARASTRGLMALGPIGLGKHVVDHIEPARAQQGQGLVQPSYLPGQASAKIRSNDAGAWARHVVQPVGRDMKLTRGSSPSAWRATAWTSASLSTLTRLAEAPIPASKPGRGQARAGAELQHPSIGLGGGQEAQHGAGVGLRRHVEAERGRAPAAISRQALGQGGGVLAEHGWGAARRAEKAEVIRRSLMRRAQRLSRPLAGEAGSSDRIEDRPGARPVDA
jgi:hypothetical protein